MTWGVPLVIPSTPQITNTDYGNEEIYLTVSDSGSSPITSYTATCTDGTTQYTGTSSTSRITVSGLTNGVSYNCSVTATNTAGTSTASTPSPPFTLPATPPDAPTIDSITTGDGKAYISVSVSNNGGAIISSYSATCTDGTTDYTGTSSTSRITVSGLTNGVSYSCSVTATNAAGASPASASSLPITPEAFIATGLPIWLLYEAAKPASP